MELALIGGLMALVLAGMAAMQNRDERIPVRVRAKDGRRCRRP